MDYKAEFIRIFSENVSRPGAQQLLDWLATTDFYTAPASTRFHGACECGLVMHSINVYNVLMSRFYTEEDNRRVSPSFLCCTTCARPITTNRGSAT